LAICHYFCLIYNVKISMKTICTNSYLQTKIYGGDDKYIYIGEYFSISKALSIYLKLKHIISLYQPFKPYYFNNWAIGEIDCTRIYVRDLFGKIPFFNNRISMVFFINQMLWYIYNIMPNSYNPFIKKKKSNSFLLVHKKYLILIIYKPKLSFIYGN
jgi:hypothetical protein